MENIQEPVLGLGKAISEHFTGKAWLNMLSSQAGYDCNIYNVTFAPSARNFWHTHGKGQILLCTEGEGYYQEKGKPAQRLVSGDVVNIPPDILHWHGAAPERSFTHIGITPMVSVNDVEWGREVTGEEYDQAVR